MALKRKRDERKMSFRVISLDEEIRLEECGLKALLERQASVNQQLVAERLKAKRLLEQRLQLKEREKTLKAARWKHLSLESELQASLQKSREKLSRLVNLEHEEEVVTDKNDNLPNDATLTDDDASQDTNPNNNNNNNNNNSVMVSVPLVDLHSSELLLYPNRDRPKKSLQAFRPIQSSSMLVEIMLMYLSEARSLDFSFEQQQEQQQQMFGDTTMVVRSTQRRTILWNTCLDLMLHRDPFPFHTKLSSLERTVLVEEATKKSLVALDPNVSLCPYELAGICADDYCPYQHTKREKTRSMFPRELLPLPPLQLVAADDHLRFQHKERVQQVVKNVPSHVENEDEAADSMEIDSNDPEEENFISLPQADEDALTEDDDEESEEEEELDVGVVSAYLKEAKQGDTFSFWWGGELDKEAGDPLLSVTDVLQSISGVNVHAKNVQLPNSTEGWIPWLGQMVDVCSISTHAGRHDIAHSILDKALAQTLQGATPGDLEPTLPSEYDGMLQKEVLEAFYITRIGHVIPLLHKIRNWAFRSDESPYSPSYNAFVIQSSYAILSAYVKARHQASLTGTYLGYPHDAPHNGSRTYSVSGFTMAAIDILMNLKDSPGETTSATLVRERHPVEQLKVYLHATDEDADVKTAAIRDFRDLNRLILWAKETFHSGSPWLAECSQMVLEDQILKPCWQIVTHSIWKSTNETKEWKCLQGTIVMGFVILGCLEKFAISVRRFEDSLNASLTAALTSLDSLNHRILKDLSNQVSDSCPLLNLVLSPLVSASVATVTFLRMYSAAQNRLETVLVKKRQARSMWMQYSELLWCQLVHLRMSLPTGATAEDEDIEPGESDYTEPSVAARKEVAALADTIEKLGIHLWHISLLGDSNLVRTKEWTKKPTNAVEKLEKASESIRCMIFDNQSPRDLVVHRAVDLSNVSLKHRCNGTDMPLSSICPSGLPRSILLAHSCTRLSLQKCTLTQLPPSIGVDLVNLIRLDVSRNHLRQLPQSMRAMLSLQELIVSHNKMSVVPEVGGTKLRILHAAHNLLSQLPFFLASRPSLEEVDLSHNQLDNDDTKKELFKSNLILNLKQLRTVTMDPQQDLSA